MLSVAVLGTVTFGELIVVAIYRDASRIVTTIFQPAQTIEKDGRRFGPSDVADNAAHDQRA